MEDVVVRNGFRTVWNHPRWEWSFYSRFRYAPHMDLDRVYHCNTYPFSEGLYMAFPCQMIGQWDYFSAALVIIDSLDVKKLFVNPPGRRGVERYRSMLCHAVFTFKTSYSTPENSSKRLCPSGHIYDIWATGKVIKIRLKFWSYIILTDHGVEDDGTLLSDSIVNQFRKWYFSNRTPHS